MTAWPAVKELRTEAAVNGALGVALVAAAIAVDAPHLGWVVLGAIVLCAASVFPVRRQAGDVAALTPLPDGHRAPRGPQWLGRGVYLVFSAAATALAALYVPVFVGIVGFLLVDLAILAFVRAAVVARAERRHGAPIVRITDPGLEADRYFVVAH